MSQDIYTKAILTLIALALWGILLKPVFVSDSAVATRGVVDVNIKEVDGKRIDKVLDVNLEEVNGRKFSGERVPVKIGN